MKIAISGSTGLIGKALSKALTKRGDTVYQLVRDKEKASDYALYLGNDICDISGYEEIDVFINLAGENIAASRWTEKQKKKILESRVEMTKQLCAILLKLKKPPKLLINGSAIGFYGDKREEILTEENLPGSNFLADVCKKWELATENLNQSSIRVVFLRTGAVLSKQGGMLTKIVSPFKLGLGGKIGSGKQYFSFISLSDLVKIILFIIDHSEISGPLNAVVPNPVTNEEFTKALGKKLNRPTFFNVPGFVARLIFGQMADELLLTSQKVYPEKLKNHHFHFDYPTLQAVLEKEI